MKLYKVNQFDNNHFMAIKSFICVANSEEEASQIDPSYDSFQWALSEKNIVANYLGRTTLYKRGQIVMRSFDDEIIV